MLKVCSCWNVPGPGTHQEDSGGADPTVTVREKFRDRTPETLRLTLAVIHRYRERKRPKGASQGQRHRRLRDNEREETQRDKQRDPDRRET